MARLAAAGAGAAAAALAQGLALLLSGAGHGWVEPFFFSAAMWITLPFVAVRLARPSPARWVDLILLLSGLVLDTLLAIATLHGGGRLFPMFGNGTQNFAQVLVNGLPVVLLWASLWLSWQVAALILILRCGRS